MRTQNTLYTLADVVTMVGPQTAAVFADLFGPQGPKTGVIQVELDDAVVELQGRLDRNVVWQTLKTYHKSAADEVVLMPELRVNVLEHNAGTITVIVLA